MNLENLTNTDLVTDVKFFVKKERDVVADIVLYLNEIESRKIHLARGFGSLHQFAIIELGYTRAAAHRRILAMRLLRELPRREANLRDGSLPLSNAAAVEAFFRNEDRHRRQNKEPIFTPEEKWEVTEKILNRSCLECERILAELSPRAVPSVEKKRAVKGQRVKLEFSISVALNEKIELLQELLAHKGIGNRLEALMEDLVEARLKQLNPEPRPSGAPPASEPTKKKTSQSVNGDAKTRYIRVSIRRSVRSRDSFSCTYRDPVTGRRCSSRAFLQFDHFPTPFSQGGKNTIDNLTLRCGAHNRYLAEKAGLHRPRESASHPHS